MTSCTTSFSRDSSKCLDFGRSPGDSRRLTRNRALQAQDVADAVLYMLSQPLNISIKALDVVATGEFFFLGGGS